MTKCKRKLLPAEPYEIDALESWFSDLSAEGLHVQKANALFATFIEGEKKRLLFRMEPKQAGALSTLDKIKAEERHAQHKEKGWSFVCKLDQFYVYAAEEGTADYFATPEEEGAYYPDSLKGNKFFNFIHIENLLIVVLIAAYIFVLHRQTTYDWVEGFANPFCNLPVLFFAILAGRRSRGFVKLQRSLAAGEPHHQPTDWQTARLRWKHRFHYVCVIGMITFLLLYAVDSYYQRDGNAKEDWWEREANLVNSYPTFGSPVDLAYNQAGRISDKTDALGEPYESVLWVEYRRLAFFLSPKEYIKEYLGKAYEAYETTALEDTPFDYALLAKGKNHTRLYLVSGQTLLELHYYYGDADLTKHYDLYEKALKEMQKK